MLTGIGNVIAFFRVHMMCTGNWKDCCASERKWMWNECKSQDSAFISLSIYSRTVAVEYIKCKKYSKCGGEIHFRGYGEDPSHVENISSTQALQSNGNCIPDLFIGIKSNLNYTFLGGIP